MIRKIPIGQENILGALHKNLQKGLQVFAVNFSVFLPKRHKLHICIRVKKESTSSHYIYKDQ